LITNTPWNARSRLECWHAALSARVFSAPLWCLPPAAMAARREKARQQEYSRQEVLSYVSEQRTMEAQARHNVSLTAAATAAADSNACSLLVLSLILQEKLADMAQAREAQEREYEEAQIAALRQVGYCKGQHICTAMSPIVCNPSCCVSAACLQAQELQNAARQRLAEEARAAEEAEAEHWEATRHQREVQLLLQRSDELRQLKEKLHAAEVTLGRVQQQEQRAVLDAREREYSAAVEAVMVQQREAAAAKEAAEAARRVQGEEEARQALSQQMKERTELQRVAKVRIAMHISGMTCTTDS
jgi:hypothetical protein